MITSIIGESRGLDFLKIEFPKAQKGKSDLGLVEKLIEFNGSVWKAKKDGGISLREGIEGIEISSELKNFEKDLKSAHKI
ncbi:MAG: hypothetical protein KC506_02250 [Nanoarchaeota archaeon]|nr:hypothetical protein [Nanoarchaeota archaeon]